jgi:hypothetical protein
MENKYPGKFLSFEVGSFSNAKECFEHFTCPNTLTKIHGDDIVIADWNNKTRHLQYKYDISSAPLLLRKPIGKKHIDVYVTQNIRDCNEERCILQNEFQFCGIVSKIVSAKTTIEMTKTTVNTWNDVGVYLFPPARGFVRSYMYKVVENELQKYKNIVSQT